MSRAGSRGKSRSARRERRSARRDLPTSQRDVLRQNPKTPRDRSPIGDGSHCRRFETCRASALDRNGFFSLAQKLELRSPVHRRGGFRMLLTFRGESAARVGARSHSARDDARADMFHDRTVRRPHDHSIKGCSVPCQRSFAARQRSCRVEPRSGRVRRRRRGRGDGCRRGRQHRPDDHGRACHIRQSRFPLFVQACRG